MTLSRIQRLQSEAAAAGLDAIAVVPGPNMGYLTGLTFHLSERPTVAFFPVDGSPALLVPALEGTKARNAPIEFMIFTYDDVAGPAGAFGQALNVLNLAGKRLGVEGRRMRFLEIDLMERSGHSPQLSNADEVIAQLRMRKDETEIEAMRRAVALAQQALEATLPAIKAGVTEKEIVAELTLQLLRAGSEAELPFQPLAAAGLNGANPHATASDSPVQPGDLLTLDWGAAVNGYFSDITRTYAIGGAPPPDELRRAYEVVREANRAGRAAVRPGATGQDVDRAARQVIEEAGLGRYFIHRTGHGLGLETHEEPDMKEGSLMPLEAGMTFTVEPGVYLPDLGGVRIEDDMVVTESGGESLTTLPRGLTTIG
ncbi:MAG: M24 family metallopeptidase [Anaerolineae bacterium]